MVEMIQVANVEDVAGAHLQSEAVVVENVDGRGAGVEAAAGDEQQRWLATG